MTSFAKKWKKETVSTEVWFNRNFSKLPEFKLDPLNSNIFASYSGPDCGLAFVHNLENTSGEKPSKEKLSDGSSGGKFLAGCSKWSVKNRKAYGISMSLYDQHPVNGKITGDPIADCFCLCARENCAVMIVADGVNWGEKPRLAARCAVYGAMKHINQRLFQRTTTADEGRHEDGIPKIVESDEKQDANVSFGNDFVSTENEENGNKDGVTMSMSFLDELGVLKDGDRVLKKIETTKDIFKLLLVSLEMAHKTILKHNGGLTTLCVCLVCPIVTSPEDSPEPSSSPTMDHSPIKESFPPKTYAACVVNVGDSLAFVFSRRHGIREITTGSHDVTLERNIRDAGGALGPVSETGEPELNNLTCSITCIEASDVVFLATDGITDNFDPVVTKIAVAKKAKPQTCSCCNESTTKNENKTLQQSDEDKNKHFLLTTTQQSQQHSTEAIATSQQKLKNEEVNRKPEEVQGQQDLENNEPIEKEMCQLDINDKKVVLHNKTEEVDNEKGKQDDNNPDKSPLKQDLSESSDLILKGDLNSLSSVEESVVSKVGPDGSQQQDGGETKENPVNDKGKTTIPTCETSCDKNYADSSSSNKTGEDENLGLEDGKPVMLPFERHRYAIKEMERIIHEFELFTECPCSAQELCGALLQHVLKLTDPKRKVLENPDLYGKRKRLKAEERQNRDFEIVSKLAQSPGKLDHATVIGYEVGCYHGNEDEDYCPE